MQADTMKAALIYAAKLGWSVLPLHSIKAGVCTCGKADCTSSGKHPLLRNGVKGATLNTKVIRSAWGRWPFANVGIATGAASGFFVLDVDGEIGGESLKELEAEHGKIPATIEQITGGGGRHLLFKSPKNINIGNKVRLFDGIDIRGDGGYIVAPPSIHISGRRYEWEISSRPFEVEMAEPPKWLIELIQQSSAPTPGADWPGLITEIPKGERNQTLARYAGRLINRRITGKETLLLILALNGFACRPPLPEDEVKKIVDSICAAELQKTRRAQKWKI